jgi:Fic family protein
MRQWIMFFLRGVAQQSKDAEDRTVRLVELQANTRQMLLDNGASLNVVRAAEGLFSTPYTSAARLAEGLGVTAPTARSVISFLVDQQILEETTGRKRGRFYSAPAIFEAVYGPTIDGDDEPALFTL